MKRILALCPSISKTGWAILEQGPTKLTHIASGCFTTDPQRSTLDRVTQIGRYIGEEIRDKGVTQIILEEPTAWPGRSKTGFENMSKLFAAFGSLCLVVGVTRLPNRVVPSKEWRKGVTATDMQKAFASVAGFPRSTEAVEAVALGLWALTQVYTPPNFQITT